MKVNSIDTENIVPVEYSHTHDGKILFRKYRENFNFGLTVYQYYFNEDAKDKKTNYNTQYTITNLQPLSTVAELDIPYTTVDRLAREKGTQALNYFSTTIRHDGKYLQTKYNVLPAVGTGNIGGVNNTYDTLKANPRSMFVDESNYTSVTGTSAEQAFVYTFTLTSISADDYRQTGSSNPSPEDRLILSHEYNSTTWYLCAARPALTGIQAPYTGTSTWGANTTAFWVSANMGSTVPEDEKIDPLSSTNSYWRYGLEGNKITLLTSLCAGRVCTDLVDDNIILSLSASPGSFTTAAGLSTSYFDITRHVLTKDFKYIPNSYNKYISSFNTDTVDLNTSTVVDHISNNYFIFTNNYNFYDSKVTSNENKITTHADFFPLKNQATLHEYYAENNHFNSEPGYLNRVYEKINAGVNQQRGYDKIE